MEGEVLGRVADSGPAVIKVIGSRVHTPINYIFIQTKHTLVLFFSAFYSQEFKLLFFVICLPGKKHSSPSTIKPTTKPSTPSPNNSDLSPSHRPEGTSSCLPALPSPTLTKK